MMAFNAGERENRYLSTLHPASDAWLTHEVVRRLLSIHSGEERESKSVIGVCAKLTYSINRALGVCMYYVKAYV
jgi:hypothetical protein